jgi:hypothetical protein
VVLVDDVAVGAEGIPVNTVLIFCACTNAVVAIRSSFVKLVNVGPVGDTAKAGPLVTNAVVAICVELVPDTAVGAVGVPANMGLLVTNAVVAN